MGFLHGIRIPEPVRGFRELGFHLSPSPVGERGSLVGETRSPDRGEPGSCPRIPRRIDISPRHSISFG